MVRPRCCHDLFAFSFIILCLVTLGHAVETTNSGKSDKQGSSDIANDSKCEIKGNVDLYGLGVRLGILYLSAPSVPNTN